jgi:hypothetical protein
MSELTNTELVLLHILQKKLSINNRGMKILDEKGNSMWEYQWPAACRPTTTTWPTGDWEVVKPEEVNPYYEPEPNVFKFTPIIPHDDFLIISKQPKTNRERFLRGIKDGKL